MATTLTREALLEKAKPRYKEVEVPGFGVVGIRSTTLVQQSHRSSRLFDDDGNIIQRQVDHRQVHTIIDQVMADENTPLFSSADTEMIASLDPSVVLPLINAIREFNGESEVVEKKDESADSSGS